jgi:hypothetical protein
VDQTIEHLHDTPVRDDWGERMDTVEVAIDKLITASKKDEDSPCLRDKIGTKTAATR